MNIEITNSSKKPIRRAGVNFGPGKNVFKQNQFTSAQLAQITSDALLSLSYVAPSDKTKGNK